MLKFRVKSVTFKGIEKLDIDFKIRNVVES